MPLKNFSHLLRSVAFAACLVPALSRAANTFLWEGFEREVNWYAGDAATGRVIDEELFSEGKHSLRLPFKTVAQSGKAGYSRFEGGDWSPYGALLLDVHNPTDLPALRCKVVIFTGRGVGHEVVLPRLSKGWNRDLRVDLTAANFSTPASGHQAVGYLVGRGEFQGLVFVIEPGEAAEGALNIDNLRLERTGVLTIGDFTLNTTLEGVASTGDLGYLPPGMRLQGSDFTLIESFETGTASWNSGQDGVRIEQTGAMSSHGKFGLEVSFPQLPGGFDIDLNGLELRLAGSRQLRIDVHNPGSGLEIRLWMIDAEGNYYSASQWLGHGWNTPVFDFTNQNSWSGAIITEQVLAGLTEVGVTVYAAYAGRLVFDGLSASSIHTRAAGKLNLLASFSYNPSQDLEVIADMRLEDTFYGSEISNARDSGTEVTLDAAGLRWDREEFRTKATYRRRITAFDHPINSLISPYKVGQEISAWEGGGHLGDVEVQALALSRLEYGRYNSRVPTGLGPESIAGLRARTKVWEGGRLGSTFYSHHARFGDGVAGLPGSRQTVGLDLDSHWKAGPLTVNWALEGAASSGDKHRDLANVYAPLDDAYYAAAKVIPQWERLSLEYWYTLNGYEFDADFSQYGGNSEWHFIGGEIKLEDLGVLKALRQLPFYDQSIGNNLRLGVECFILATRTGYLEAGADAPVPSTRVKETDIRLSNDEKSKPSFRLHGEEEAVETQWSLSRDRKVDLGLRVPLGWNVLFSASGGHKESWDTDKGQREGGLGGAVFFDGGLEWYSDSNLSLNVQAQWSGSRESWQGEWGPYEKHIKWTASIEQSLGPNSVVRLDYGRPALLGYDFGLQDTLPVLTLTGKIYL